MIEFELPVKTESTNRQLRGITRGALFAAAKKAKLQKHAARLMCPKWKAGPLLIVHLVRVSPGTLDDDNLVGSLKHVRDGIAAAYGLDDASPLVRFTYGQDKGEAAVRVTIAPTAKDGIEPSPLGLIGPRSTV